MFQSFTGNSRRPRQVNLSGRNTNPFAAFPGGAPGRQPPHPSSPQSAVAIAQQERIQRQREREKQNASRVIQRVWRGHRSRKHVHGIWQADWDANEQSMLEAMGVAFNPDSQWDGWTSLCRPAPYATAEQCLTQLRLLMHFFSVRNHEDILRLAYFADAFEQTFRTLPTIATEGEWTELLKRLAKTILRVLGSATNLSVQKSTVEQLLQALKFLVGLIPRQMATIAGAYYDAMASLTKNASSLRLRGFDELDSRGLYLDPETLKPVVVALLVPLTSQTTLAYEAFATSYLTIPNLEALLGQLDGLASEVNYRMLAMAVLACLGQTTQGSRNLEDVEARTWLLSYLIFIHRYALGSEENPRAPELEYVTVISDLLNSTAAHLMQRLEADESSDSDSPTRMRPLHPFIKEQVLSLINPHNITGLLSPIRTAGSLQAGLTTNDFDATQEARVFATYALNLLRIFPRRGDDIRMWLYLGAAPSGEQGFGQPKAKIPAIKYFWQASRSSQVFQIISNDSTRVLQLLRPEGHSKGAINVSQEQRDHEWTTLLLFLELYTFVLKVMDDDEFFTGTSSFTTTSETTTTSWTRESALPLSDVKDVTVFLKNLAFTLYWNAFDLSEPERGPAPTSLSSYFNSAEVPGLSDTLPSTSELETKGQTHLPGVTGIPLDYFKGLVTGLLRMIHERDSRRKFLPRDHWLMTDRFDMEGFIPAVVREEEKRHEIQARSGDAEEFDPDDEMAPHDPVGTGHARRIMRQERLRRHQQRLARGRALAALAPRLEILRNMPFFIPFATRVQIFREFIFTDQYRRRHGFVDPDAWRASIMQGSIRMIDTHPARNTLSMHQAQIWRERVFEDALDEFWDLGDGLKEPIQISFVDKFGAVEAGIDGGGVTKEFLTSVTAEGFQTGDGFRMFVENDQHLIYPNPTAFEQCKEHLRDTGLNESSPEWTPKLRNLLQRYEFLGRILGKCLYEGILIDVNFAPFFLLKWALTGGTGSALKESSYRANLNDLKDLDDELYQGLLKLKNYTGDVEQDFGLDFTVTDTIPMVGSKDRTKTTNLRPNGSEIPVTNQNRLVYISYMARYRLQTQPALQTNAFLKGLGQIIQPSWLSMFNQSELQTLVSGERADIDVEDLRRNTLYGGLYTIGDDGQEHPTIQLFWQVMHEMTNEERQKVLRFVTSTPRAPLLGFSHLHPRFSIRDSSEEQERLPSTSTCVNLLKLPRYMTADILRERLLYAINSGAGFDLS